MASRARRSGSQMNGGGGHPAFSTRDPALARKCVSQASDHQTRSGKQPLEEHTRATFELKKQASQEQHCVSMQTSPTADLKAVTANILVDRAVQLSPNPVFEPAQRDLPLVVTEVQTEQVPTVMRSMQTSPEPLPPTPAPAPQSRTRSNSKNASSGAPSQRAPSVQVEVAERALQTSPILLHVQAADGANADARIHSPTAASLVSMQMELEMEMEKEKGAREEWRRMKQEPENDVLASSASGVEVAQLKQMAADEAGRVALVPTPQVATPLPDQISTKQTQVPTPRAVPAVKGGGCMPFWRKTKVNKVLEAPQEEMPGATTPVAPLPPPQETRRMEKSAVAPLAASKPSKVLGRGISMSTSFLDGNIVTAASQTEAPATAESAMQTAKVHRRPKEAAEEDTTTAGVEAKKSPKKHRGGKVGPVSRESTNAELTALPKQAAPVASDKAATAEPKPSSCMSAQGSCRTLQAVQGPAVDLPDAASSPTPGVGAEVEPPLVPGDVHAAAAMGTKLKAGAEHVDVEPLVEPLMLPSSRAPTAASTAREAADTAAQAWSTRTEKQQQQAEGVKKPGFWRRLRDSFRSSRSKVEPPPALLEDAHGTVDRSAQVSRLDDTEGQLLRVEGKLDRILDVGQSQTNKLERIDAQITEIERAPPGVGVGIGMHTTFAVEHSGAAGELDFVLHERTVRSARATVFGAHHPLLSAAVESLAAPDQRGRHRHAPEPEPPLVLESVRSRELTLTSASRSRAALDEIDAHGTSKAGSKKGSAAPGKKAHKAGKEKGAVSALASDAKVKGSKTQILSRETTDASKSALVPPEMPLSTESTHISSAKGLMGSLRSAKSVAASGGHVGEAAAEGEGGGGQCAEADECEKAMSDESLSSWNESEDSVEARTSVRASMLEKDGLPSATGGIARREPNPVEVTRCSKTCSIM